MKVKELIEMLQKLDQEKEVKISASCWNQYGGDDQWVTPNIKVDDFKRENFCDYDFENRDKTGMVTDNLDFYVIEEGE